MQPKIQEKRSVAAAVGGLFILFAVIGIVTITILSIRLTKSLLDNTKQKEELEHLLQPVVMFDPVPFSKLEDIDNKRLLLYSMWGVLSDEKVTNYSRSPETQALLVPAPDLDAAARKIFGSGAQLDHETFNDNVTSYFYNKTTNTYEVPTYGFLYVYRPEILEIQKDGDTYELLIHYIPPDNAWDSVFVGGDLSGLAAKQMIYVMERQGKDWRLVEIKEVPRDTPIGVLPEVSEEEIPEALSSLPEEETAGEEPVAGTQAPPVVEESIPELPAENQDEVRSVTEEDSEESGETSEGEMPLEEDADLEVRPPDSSETPDDPVATPRTE